MGSAERQCHHDLKEQMHYNSMLCCIFIILNWITTLCLSLNRLLLQKTKKHRLQKWANCNLKVIQGNVVHTSAHNCVHVKFLLTMAFWFWGMFGTPSDRRSDGAWDDPHGAFGDQHFFTELDSMIHQFERVFSGMGSLGSPAGEGAYQEVVSPRDSMLKQPDSDGDDKLVTPSQERPSHPYVEPVPHGSPFVWDPEHSPASEFPRPPDSFFGGHTPFTFMDDMFRGFFQFGDPFFSVPPSGPSPFEAVPDDSSRLPCEKKDEDLDESMKLEQNRSSLLKKGPSYRYGLSEVTPWMSEDGPRISHNFKSTSIVRIRKSDGTVEETRKYADSTGREEVTVTTTQPDHDQFVDDAYGSPDVDMGPPRRSLFSWFFR